MAYAIEPEKGWAAGDRAYCLHGSRITTPPLEVGKVYVVASARVRTGMMGAGLTLDGVRVPTGYHGISSSRFVKLDGAARPAREITRLTSPSWSEAYAMSAGQKARRS